MSARLSRRELIAIFAAAGLLAGCRTSPPTSTTSATNVNANGYTALEDWYKARIGLYAIDLNSLTTIEHRADDQFSMCSTFKTYAAARLLQLADAGAIDLNTKVAIASDEIVVDSPITRGEAGSSMSLGDICAAALIHSDNTAGNIMLRTIGGPTAITAFAQSIGDSHSRLDRWEPDLNTAVPADPRDTTTPRALCTGYRQILTADVLAIQARDRLLTWMRSNVTSSKRFRAGLPPGWTSADKTGAGDYGSTNDAGLLIGPAGQRVVVAVMTRSRDDTQDAPPFNEAIAGAIRVTLMRLRHTQE
ncbi:class A beta-lactamase [Mycobacteroides chelonae]|uniref:class A beta-lactamase n=1 Tax=Mycobacteroides chelonae TaxID=1774 RepID=UPI003AAC9740